jgi:hypothetical protein
MIENTDLGQVGLDPTLLIGSIFKMLQNNLLKPGCFPCPNTVAQRRIQNVEYANIISFLKSQNFDFQRFYLRIALHQLTRLLDNSKPPMVAANKIGKREF